MWLCSGVERGCFMTLPLGLYSLDRVYGRERRRTLRGGTSLPAPLDYDGDGDVDFTIFSGGPWHLYNDDGSYNTGIWTGGVANDQAISRRLLP